MNEKTDLDSTHEIHPYNSLPIPPGTKALIVGTAPPPRFSLPRLPHQGPREGWDADFFYGSGDNYLWLYLEGAANEKIFADPGSQAAFAEDTESLMRDFLQRHHLWMRDVLQTYRRKKNHRDSASDHHIDLSYDGTTFLDFAPILEENWGLEKVVFTSIKAAEWFFSHSLSSNVEKVGEDNYRQIFLTADKERRKRNGIEAYTEKFCTLTFGDRSVDFYIAPSPSGAAAHDEETCVKIYRRFLLE